MDGALVFRLVLIIVAGFALVMIVSNYSNSITPSTNQVSKERFQDAGYVAPPPSAPAFRAPAPAAPAPVRPVETGSLVTTAKATQSPAERIAPNAIDTLSPEDLLPRLGNTPEEQRFVSVNPSVPGDVASQNFLQAGYWQGAITNVQKNANMQLRSDPLIVPQKVSPWLNTPYEMNAPNRLFEIGSISSV